MARCTLSVRFAGPMVSLQDGGRPGLARFGVPRSGPMDRSALAVANTALGNPPGACGVEVSLGGVQLDCVEGSVTFAVAGGGFEVSLDGLGLGPWTVATLQPGQRLRIRPGVWGSWAALAFAGTLQGNRWLGSQSTHSQSGLGGGVLQSGMTLTIDPADPRPTREGDLQRPDWAAPRDTARVVIGPQDRFFDAATLQAFLSSRFTLSQNYDRMGVRLDGPKLPVAAALDMPSEAVLRGAVQVAGDGVATVLLADHGTTGGYPKIATVISPDLDDLVQRRSGEPLRFVAVTPHQAVIAARTRAAALAACLADLAQPRATLAERLMSGNLISGVVSSTDP